MDKAFPLLILLVLSGVFSGAEIALFSLKREQLISEKNKAVTRKKIKKIERLEDLQGNTQRTLVTILLCNNVVNILASSMATVLALEVGSSVGLGLSQSTILAIVTGLMTFAILLFGEITPKALAHRYAFGFSMKMGGVLWWLTRVLSPIVGPLTWLTKKFVGSEGSLMGLTQDEIKAAISLSETEGSIDAEEREMVESVLELDEVKTQEVMTPRSQIFALDEDMDFEKGLKEFTKMAFSRVPVYQKDLDNITGIITKQTMLEHISQKGITGKMKNVEKFEEYKVPTTMPIDDLLSHFKAGKTIHQANVYDEHGGLVGLVSLEDVLEEIVGEIHDETDEEIEYIKRDGEFSYIIKGESELEVIEMKLKEDHGDWNETGLPWTREEEHTTLKAYLIEKFERFPEKGETLTLKTHTWEFIFTMKGMKKEQIGIVGMDVSPIDAA